MNGKEKAIPFLEGFVKNLGNFLLGNPLDKGGNIKPLDPRYKVPGFHGLPEHQQEKEYELLRKQGPQASIFGLGKPGVDQASIFGLGGPGLPGEPGVRGVPTKNPKPLLPGEIPPPNKFATDFLNNFNPFA